MRNNSSTAPFKDMLVEDWTPTFHQSLDKRLMAYEQNAEALIVEFTASLLASGNDISPAITESLELLKDNILRSQSRIKEEAKSIFDSLKSEGSDAHHNVEEMIALAWYDVYEQCGNESGKTLYITPPQIHRYKF